MEIIPPKVIFIGIKPGLFNCPTIIAIGFIAQFL